MPNVITLKVTLKTVGNSTYLDVDQGNNGNHIPQNAETQTIQWQLEGNAASGSFNVLSGSQPGFAWKSTMPNPSPFGLPSRSANGNVITITDLNNSTSTQGTWIYQLYATVNNTTYSTTSSLLTATTNDPTIKNN